MKVGAVQHLPVDADGVVSDAVRLAQQHLLLEPQLVEHGTEHLRGPPDAVYLLKRTVLRAVRVAEAEGGPHPAGHFNLARLTADPCDLRVKRLGTST